MDIPNTQPIPEGRRGGSSSANIEEPTGNLDAPIMSGNGKCKLSGVSVMSAS